MKHILFFFHRILRALGNRFLDKELANPRFFSNHMLRKYADNFEGSIINVSGWDDRDFEGGFYKGYFKKSLSYIVSNAPEEDKGLGSMKESAVEEIGIDLMNPIGKDLIGKYDVVFNHTTLEHILDVQGAFKNLCDLSRDAVIIVVPSVQNIHIKGYGDFWRMTTMGVAKMFLKNGFEPLVIKANDQPFAPIYCFAIGVRDAKKYENKIIKDLDLEMGAALYGSSLKKRYIDDILKK